MAIEKKINRFSFNASSIGFSEKVRKVRQPHEIPNLSDFPSRKSTIELGLVDWLNFAAVRRWGRAGGSRFPGRAFR